MHPCLLYGIMIMLVIKELYHFTSILQNYAGSLIFFSLLIFNEKKTNHFTLLIILICSEKSSNRATYHKSAPIYDSQAGIKVQLPQSATTLRGSSQTTFTRRGRQVVQKYPLFVKIHSADNVNIGCRWSKKAKILSTQFVNTPLRDLRSVNLETKL